MGTYDIDTGNITTFEDGTVNQANPVNSTVSEIVTKHNEIKLSILLFFLS